MTRLMIVAGVYAAGLSIAGSSLSVPARAEPKTTPPILQNLAALAVSARWCKQYTVDIESALRIALGEGKNPTKSPYSGMFEAEKEKMETVLGEVGATRFCSVNYERFKPGGAVPGFMVRN